MDNGARRTKKGAALRERCCSFSSRRKWLKIIFCWWIIKWTLIVFGYLVYLFSYELWLRVVDVFSKLSGGSSQLAVCAPVDLREFVGDTGSRDVEVELRNDLKQSKCCRKDYGLDFSSINMNVRWIPPLDHCTTTSSEVSNFSELDDDRLLNHLIDGLTCKEDKQEWEYEPASGSTVLLEELGHDSSILNAVSKMYDTDPLLPRELLKPPPVKIVKAIYGINLPTEVGAVYRRKRTLAERKDKIKSNFELDRKIKIPSEHGYILDDGIIFETKDTPQMIEVEERTVSCCGEGTVPYWSLQHIRNWKDTCNVEITELDGASHREILSDRRFHEVLIDYVTTIEGGNVDCV